MPDDKLFRKAALEKLASPERLDVLMQVTSPVGWVALGTVGFVLVCVLAWSIFGSIPTRLEGSGILMRGGGLREIRSSGDGVLEKLNAGLNAVVKDGQLFAVITQSTSEDSVRTAQQKYENAQREYEMAKLEDQSTINGLQATIAGYQSDITRTDGELARSRDDLAAKQEAFRKGLITQTRLEGIQRDISAQQSKLTSLRSQIASVNANIRSVEQRIRARQQAVDAARVELQNTQHQVATITNLTSTVEGRVVELKKAVGDRVRNGEVLALIEPPAAMLEPVVFVNSSTGKKIKPGMEAQISPATVKREEFGFMKGVVKSVGEYPVTPDAAQSIIANATLVQELIGNTAKIEMRASLMPNAHAPSGYQWSLSEGPPFKVDSGTRVTVSVVVDRKRPISLVLPIFRGTVG
jgi:HlyD family secretion protein